MVSPAVSRTLRYLAGIQDDEEPAAPPQPTFSAPFQDDVGVADIRAPQGAPAPPPPPVRDDYRLPEPTPEPPPPMPAPRPIYQPILDAGSAIGSGLSSAAQTVQDAYAVPTEQRPPQYSGPSYAPPRRPVLTPPAPDEPAMPTVAPATQPWRGAPLQVGPAPVLSDGDFIASQATGTGPGRDLGVATVPQAPQSTRVPVMPPAHAVTTPARDDWRVTEPQPSPYAEPVPVPSLEAVLPSRIGHRVDALISNAQHAPSQQLDPGDMLDIVTGLLPTVVVNQVLSQQVGEGEWRRMTGTDPLAPFRSEAARRGIALPSAEEINPDGFPAISVWGGLAAAMAVPDPTDALGGPLLGAAGRGAKRVGLPVATGLGAAAYGAAQPADSLGERADRALVYGAGGVAAGAAARHVAPRAFRGMQGPLRAGVRGVAGALEGNAERMAVADARMAAEGSTTANAAILYAPDPVQHGPMVFPIKRAPDAVPPRLEPDEFATFNAAAAALRTGQPTEGLPVEWKPTGVRLSNKGGQYNGDHIVEIPAYRTKAGEYIPLPWSGMGGAGTPLNSAYSKAVANLGGRKGSVVGAWTDARGVAHTFDSPQEAIYMAELDRQQAAGEIQEWWQGKAGRMPEVESIPYFSTNRDKGGIKKYEPDFFVRHQPTAEFPEGKVEVWEAKPAPAIAKAEEYGKKAGVTTGQMGWDVTKKAAGVLAQLAVQGVGYRLMLQRDSSRILGEFSKRAGSSITKDWASVPGFDPRDLPSLMKRGLSPQLGKPGTQLYVANETADLINATSDALIVRARALAAAGVPDSEQVRILTREARDALLPTADDLGRVAGQTRNMEMTGLADITPYGIAHRGPLTLDELQEIHPDGARVMRGIEQLGARLGRISIDEMNLPDGTTAPHLLFETSGDPQAAQLAAARLGQASGTRSGVRYWDAEGPVHVADLAVHGDRLLSSDFDAVRVALGEHGADAPQVVARYNSEGVLEGMHVFGHRPDGTPLTEDQLADALVSVQDALAARGGRHELRAVGRAEITDFGGLAGERGHAASQSAAVERSEQILGLRPTPYPDAGAGGARAGDAGTYAGDAAAGGAQPGLGRAPDHELSGLDADDFDADDFTDDDALANVSLFGAPSTGAQRSGVLPAVTRVLGQGVFSGVTGTTGGLVNQEMNPDDPQAFGKGFVVGAAGPVIAQRGARGLARLAGARGAEEAGGALASAGGLPGPGGAQSPLSAARQALRDAQAGGDPQAIAAARQQLGAAVDAASAPATGATARALETPTQTLDVQGRRLTVEATGDPAAPFVLRGQRGEPLTLVPTGADGGRRYFIQTPDGQVNAGTVGQLSDGSLLHLPTSGPRAAEANRIWRADLEAQGQGTLAHVAAGALPAARGSDPLATVNRVLGQGAVSGITGTTTGLVNQELDPDDPRAFGKGFAVGALAPPLLARGGRAAARLAGAAPTSGPPGAAGVFGALPANLARAFPNLPARYAAAKAKNVAEMTAKGISPATPRELVTGTTETVMTGAMIGPASSTVNFAQGIWNPLWAIPKEPIRAGVRAVQHRNLAALREPGEALKGTLTGLGQVADNAWDVLRGKGQYAPHPDAPTLSQKVADPLGRAALQTLETPTRFWAGLPDAVFGTLAQHTVERRRAAQLATEAGKTGKDWESWVDLYMREAERARSTNAPAHQIGAGTKDVLAAGKTAADRAALRSDLGSVGKAMKPLASLGLGNVPVLRQIVSPFYTTRFNAWVQALERTPVGLAMNTQKGFDKVYDATVGTALALGMANYAMNNHGVSGSGPSDRNERQGMIDKGWRPYSLYVNGAWIPSRAFGPGAEQLLNAAGEIHDGIAYQKKDADTRALSEDALARIGKLAKQAPYASGYATIADFVQFGPAAAAADVATQVTPFASTARAIGTAGDTAERTVDRGKGVPLEEEFAQRWQQATGQRSELPVAQDILGRPKENPQPGVYAFTGRIGWEKDDPVISAFQAADVSIADPREHLTDLGIQVDLTPDERRRWDTLRGAEIIKQTQTILDNGTLGRLPPERQAARLEDIKRSAATRADLGLKQEIGTAEWTRRRREAQTLKKAG